jgi:hypothetical protein
MAAGTISPVAVLRDARILRQAQERAPQDEVDSWYRYDSNFGNAALEHDPEKWEPVFGKDHAPTISWGGMTIRRKVIPL